MNRRLSRSSLLAVSLLAAFTGVAHAQWTWLYPKPHGNNLYDVTFVSDITAIAVGDVGTIMVSHDAGLTWATSFRTNSVASKLNRIDRIDDATAVAVGNGGVILKTIDGGTSWSSLAGAGVSDLIDVSFSGSTGIALGYGPWPTPNRMYRSTNGGNTWTVVAGAPLPAYAVDMVTPLVGYCVASFLSSSVFKTIDGGLTWTATPTPAAGHTNGAPVAFSDELHGTTGSSSSEILVTADGGATWTPRPIGTIFLHGGSHVTDLECRSPSLIFASVVETACDLAWYMACSSWGKLSFSPNDGANWQYHDGQRPLNGVAVNSAGIQIVVGQSGVIHRWSAPAWQQVAGTTAFDDLPDAAHLAFPTPGTGVVLGSITRDPYESVLSANEIFHTATAGSSWEVGYWGYPYSNMNDVAYATGTSDLYAVATESDGATKSSSLLKSVDGGSTWVTAWSSAQDLRLVSLEFSSPTHGVAVGRAGKALIIDGPALATVTIPSGMTGLGFADASTVIAVGDGTTRIIRSTDGGTTWNPVTSPIAKALYDVAFSDPSIGVIVGPNNIVLRTTDGGLSWSTLTTPLPATEFLTAVSFSGNYGMAVGGYGGAVIETEDAGLTWTVLSPPATGLLSDVVVFGAHRALVAGPEMTVLEYRDNAVPTLFSSFGAVPHEFAAALRWEVSTDGQLANFSIARTNGTNRRIIAADLAASTRSFRDEGLTPGATYEYQLIAIDRDGSYTQSMPVSVTIPKAALELLPNQPNPFNPETTIRFVVPEKMRVTLTVHDVAGRVVATLADGVSEPGLRSITWKADGLASGVYFARLRAGKMEVSQKMVLLK
ncbi:MAG TPA: YCF48-related protein [Candidatus Krumholzibacteria bacterium]